MSTPIFLTVYSNGDMWISKDVNFAAPASETGTVVKHFRINTDASPQKLTTLTGSGNASASALAASGGQANRHGAGATADSVDIT